MKNPTGTFCMEYIFLRPAAGLLCGLEACPLVESELS